MNPDRLRSAMSIPRSCGVLLHPTSLPGGHGIGDLGWEAYRFVDFLAAAGQRYWQVLPLGPTGYGDSPYQCFSAFAGNHLLISLERLAEEGLVTSTLPAMPGGNVNYGFVVQEKMHHLKDAFKTFRERASAIQKERFSSFMANPRARWLDDYALFRAIKDHFNGASWTSWDKDLVDRKPEALESWSRRLSEEVLLHRWLQYQFFRQWAELRAYCNASGVSIIGDVPIFVSHDSSDVWANPGLFHLDEAGNPTIVAGVPPDYFSKTGQLWGNPLYRWEKMHAAGYRWWIDRVQWGLMAVDILRLD
ncbi:MAG: 4-alpha-glucanotransferase, partial [Candidatus Riflebacteria bacterium]|nr:4-alpha-glucanotransferase [Candidatus Riflebacteria bacterium]